MAIEPAVISAIAAIAGTVVGGLASLMTSVFTQRYQDRLQRVSREVTKREALYSEFITHAARAMLKARLTEFSQENMVDTLPAIVNRIRLVASDAVIAEADAVLRDLIRTSLDAGVDARRLAEEALATTDYPLLHFSSACRKELEALSDQIR